MNIVNRIAMITSILYLVIIVVTGHADDLSYVGIPLFTLLSLGFLRGNK